MKLLVILNLLLICNILHSQDSWMLTISTPLIERIFDIHECSDGNYIACGTREDGDGNPQYGFLIKISADGYILDEQEFISQDSTSVFFKLINVTDSSIVIVGSCGPEATNKTDIWILHTDHDFSIIKQKKLPCFTGYSYVELIPKINSKGNIIIHGFLNDTAHVTDIFFYEITLEGDSISAAVIDLPYHQFANGFIERKNNQGYYSYVTGWLPVNPPGIDGMLEFDTAYNLISIDSVPRNLYMLQMALWLTDNHYLLSGKKGLHNPSYVVMGLVKLDTLNQVINEYYYGMMPDTNTYPGSSDNLDFYSPDTIYYSGTGNFNAYPWQFEPSWIIVSCLDNNLNCLWQGIYGGDAFYHSWEILATSDGGCLVSASKFDYTSPDLDYDIVLLKYDRNGLLTQLDDFNLVPSQIVIYPNPGSDRIAIINNSEGYLFELIDISGKCLLSKTIDKNLNHLDVQGIKPGIYIYRISNGSIIIASGKWIKTK